MSSNPTSLEVRFLADVMLGTLAKWLRILGYDTAYDNRIKDDEIIARCLRENRLALTRDVRLIQRRQMRNALLIESTDLASQLRQVLSTLDSPPDPSKLLSRCVHCNTALLPVAPASVRQLVPAYVFRTQSNFTECPACRRIYWGGTHRDRIRKRLNTLLDRVPHA